MHIFGTFKKFLTKAQLLIFVSMSLSILDPEIPGGGGKYAPHAISALLEPMLIGVKIKILWSLLDIVSCVQIDSRRLQVGGNTGNSATAAWTRASTICCSYSSEDHKGAYIAARLSVTHCA